MKFGMISKELVGTGKEMADDMELDEDIKSQVMEHIEAAKSLLEKEGIEPIPYIMEECLGQSSEER
jgi:hypothetical protein